MVLELDKDGQRDEEQIEKLKEEGDRGRGIGVVVGRGGRGGDEEELEKKKDNGKEKE